jgi:hypothetical protein
MIETKRRLLNVYVRNQMLLAHHMVQHPEYGKKYIAQVTAIIDGAYNLNVRCAFLSDDGVGTIRAEMLELIGRTALTEARTLWPIRARGDTERRLRWAADAVRLGIEIVYDQQREERNTKMNSPTLADKIGSTSAIEAYDSLLRMHGALQGALNELATN